MPGTAGQSDLSKVMELVNFSCHLNSSLSDSKTLFSSQPMVVFPDSSWWMKKGESDDP